MTSPPEMRNGPSSPTGTAPTNSTNHSIPHHLGEYVEHFRTRVLQDALTEATREYWTRRAQTFEAAMPRPGDFTGRATPEDLTAQRERLASTAAACRQRAAVSLVGGDVA